MLLHRSQWLVSSCLFALAVGAALPVSAQTTTVLFNVPGTSNPWLAGMPAGTTSGGDTAPNESPVLVTGIKLNTGAALTFSATGAVGNQNGVSDPPDGNVNAFTSHGAENGISDVTAPVDALMGVFLGPAQPDTTGAPTGLDYSTRLDYSSLAPGLKEVFFIGDGHNSANTVQKVFIPSGATRFYLGTMDGGGWYNNPGSFSVTVNGPATGAAVPEPGLGSLLAGGIVALATLATRKRGWQFRN